MSLFLGLETSCDDTSVALVAGDGEVLKLYKYTKDEDHRPFGGIVPERASRNHLKSIVSLLKEIETDLNKSFGLSFKELSGIGYTSRPGLLGSLIVGSVAAKTLSQVFDTPIYPVNHLEGHVLSPWLYEKSNGFAKEMVFPHLSLIVSGGHTQLVLVKAIGDYEILGSTRDDAVGEAIDKFSKSLGLGFPGGPIVDKKSLTGNPKAHSFPRPMIKEPHYDFSFSGLKASASRYILEKKNFSETEVNDLCASYLEACVEVLEVKTKKALMEYKPKGGFSVAGGVSANSLLRKRFESLAKDLDTPLFIPPLKFCTDNGAMIALVAALRLSEDKNELNFEPSSKSLAGDFYDKR